MKKLKQEEVHKPSAKGGHKKPSEVFVSSSCVSVPPSHSRMYHEFEHRLEKEQHILEQNLTEENYKKKFHHLLCWEEREHDEQLAVKYVCIFV